MCFLVFHEIRDGNEKTDCSQRTRVVFFPAPLIPFIKEMIRRMVYNWRAKLTTVFTFEKSRSENFIKQSVDLEQIFIR